MAKMPSKMPTPAPEDDEDETGMDAPDGNQGTDDQEEEPGDEGEHGGDDEDDGIKILGSFGINEQGEFVLIHGDEDEEGEGDESDEDEEGGEEGAGGEEKEQEPQVFATEGELLKAVLDCIRQEKGEDESSAEHDFAGGYNEEKGPMQPPATAGRNAM